MFAHLDVWNEKGGMVHWNAQRTTRKARGWLAQTQRAELSVTLLVHAESVRQFEPRVCFETLGKDSPSKIGATLKELRRFLCVKGDAIPSELRPTKNSVQLPRVVKAQPWAKIGQRFQR